MGIYCSIRTNILFSLSNTLLVSGFLRRSAREVVSAADYPSRGLYSRASSRLCFTSTTTFTSKRIESNENLASPSSPLSLSPSDGSMDLRIPCSDGIQIAAKYWKPPSSSPSADPSTAPKTQPPHRIVCLHGWLDNAASFHLLAPAIHSRLMLGGGYGKSSTSNQNIHVLALENPGHGHSSHKSPDGPTQLRTEYALYLSEALISLGWVDHDSKTNNDDDKSKDGNGNDTALNSGGITLIAHSAGTADALIYAAAFPEHVNKVVLLDGLGPMPQKTEDVSKHIRNAFKHRVSSNRALYPIHDTNNNNDGNSNNKNARVYSNLDRAISLRMKTATLLPGKQYISREAATAIVSRGSIPAAQESNPQENQEVDFSTYTGPVKFRHDQRLHWPSLHYFTHDQVNAIYRDVQCPVCLLYAVDGWPSPDAGNVESFEAILKPVVNKQLPGSHHFHADPDTVEAVIDEIVRFLK